MCTSCGCQGRWRARGSRDRAATQRLDERPVPRQTPIERFLEPCLLLALAGGPAHGYVLKEHCETDCLVEEPIDPGTLYRTLRRMEASGWLHSSWSAEGPGPRRRVYELTPVGAGVLQSWALGLRRNKQTIESFLSLFEQRFGLLGEDGRPGSGVVVSGDAKPVRAANMDRSGQS